jgi:hypothetical protein
VLCRQAHGGAAWVARNHDELHAASACALGSGVFNMLRLVDSSGKTAVVRSAQRTNGFGLVRV